MAAARPGLTAPGEEPRCPAPARQRVGINVRQSRLSAPAGGNKPPSLPAAVMAGIKARAPKRPSKTPVRICSQQIEVLKPPLTPQIQADSTVVNLSLGIAASGSKELWPPVKTVDCTTNEEDKPGDFSPTLRLCRHHRAHDARSTDWRFSYNVRLPGRRVIRGDRQVIFDRRQIPLDSKPGTG